ncbi:hypothetical protein QQB53_05540 [Niallia sp. SS-2023]|nr:hypothetical protein [Niallia sp. SS-2023]MDL0435227.1 hypothetical protein [Niallia sp. SS-2023]
MRGNEEMVHVYVNKIKSLTNWGKIIFPASKLKYYPPQFILRDPVEQNVSAALHKGNEVAVIVFSIHNLAILKREMDSAASQRLWEQVREAFHTVIREEIPSDQIAAVRAYYQDGIALFLKIDHKMDTVPNIDFTIQLILEKLQTKVWRSLQQSVQPIFCTGYIFIDRQIDQLRDAI